MTEIKLFVAVKAFIVYDWKVLILKESSQYEDWTKTWNFDVPWGRINPWERYDKWLIREIKEETGLTVSLWKPFHMNEWRPVVKWENRQVVWTFFECFSDNDDVILSKDHDSYERINPKEYQKYPIINWLKSVFKAYLL